MYFTIDVYLWMLYRKFHNMPNLRREDDYIVVSTEDRRNYEEFRELIVNSNYSEYPMTSCPLLLKYMKTSGIPITVVKEFNCEMVTSFPQSCIDDLCEWAQAEIQSEQLKSEAYASIYLLLCMTLGIGMLYASGYVLTLLVISLGCVYPVITNLYCHETLQMLETVL